MATATDLQAGLAHDIEGTGTPVVVRHGLTFGRRTWRPVTDQLDGAVASTAIDLPAHGGSGGEPAPPPAVTEQVRRLLRSPGLQRPVAAGHPTAAGIAGLYAPAHPARGMILVDQATKIPPVAPRPHQIAPLLSGPAFGQVRPGIENSPGLTASPSRPARWCRPRTRPTRTSCPDTGITC